MPYSPEFERWCEDELARLRLELEALETRKARLKARLEGSSWSDPADRDMDALKRNIADLETSLSAHRAERSKPSP